MTYDEAVAIIRRWPTLSGVSWIVTLPGRVRAFLDDSPAPPVVEARGRPRFHGTRCQVS